jgi:hypothetical protein
VRRAASDGSFSGFFHTLLVAAAAVGMWESRRMIFNLLMHPSRDFQGLWEGRKTTLYRFPGFP